MKTDFIQVYTTVPDRKTGDTIAKELVFKNRLAACVQITRHIESYYIWQDQECQTRELLCIIKTSGKLFPLVEQKIKSIHPYEVPELVAVPLTLISDDYRTWYEAAIQDQVNKI